MLKYISKRTARFAIATFVLLLGLASITAELIVAAEIDKDEQDLFLFNFNNESKKEIQKDVHIHKTEHQDEANRLITSNRQNKILRKVSNDDALKKQIIINQKIDASTEDFESEYKFFEADNNDDDFEIKRTIDFNEQLLLGTILDKYDKKVLHTPQQPEVKPPIINI